MRLVTTLVPQAPGLKLARYTIEADRITLALSTTQPAAACSLCSTPSTRVHSRYTRTLADLPWGRFAIHLHLSVRKFVCTVATCARRIFTERLPSVVAPYARQTLRLSEVRQLVGFALGGEAGVRLLARLGMTTSPRTLLRTLRRSPLPTQSTPRILGVDEWAWRKGHRYGTLLVDLEQRRPVDLLPDRSAETFAAWLDVHPGVTVISRDRASVYAEGARQGAPHAIHVADRWHLLKNLGDSLEQLVVRYPAALRHATQVVQGTARAPALPAPAPEPLPAAPPPPTKAAQLGQARRARRYARYTEVVTLHSQGLGLQAIAQSAGLTHKTVRRWLAVPTFPEHAPRPRPSSVLDPYAPYLQQRWEAGCHNGLQLWREVVAQGYTGSRGVVARYVARLRHAHPVLASSQPAARHPPRQSWSPRQTMWLLVRRPAGLTTDEEAYITTLCEVCPELASAYALTQAFITLVRERIIDALEPWLEAAATSSLPELQSFAAGLRRDQPAVEAALTLPWSQGQVEGQVNRLKVLKRQMYGRANFDLLRLRVLQAA